MFRLAVCCTISLSAQSVSAAGGKWRRAKEAQENANDQRSRF
jgi:hypothetical protein